MKDNIIIFLLLVLITLFVAFFHRAPAYLDHAVAQSMEEYLTVQGYDPNE